MPEIQNSLSLFQHVKTGLRSNAMALVLLVHDFVLSPYDWRFIVSLYVPSTSRECGGGGALAVYIVSE